MNFKNLIKFSPSFHCVQKLQQKHQSSVIKSQKKNKVNLKQPSHTADLEECRLWLTLPSKAPRALMPLLLLLLAGILISSKPSLLLASSLHWFIPRVSGLGWCWGLSLPRRDAGMHRSTGEGYPYVGTTGSDPMPWLGPGVGGGCCCLCCLQPLPISSSEYSAVLKEEPGSNCKNWIRESTWSWAQP